MPKKHSRSDTFVSKATLQAEIQRLQSENARLQKQIATRPKSNSESITKAPRHHWKTALIVLISGLAGAILVTGNLLFWAGNTLIDTNRFISTTTPLIKNTDIQTAVASYTTQQLFANVNTQQYIQSALPDRASFLAPTLATQLQNTTESTLNKILASEKFQTVWTDSMTRNHERLINAIGKYQGDGTITLQDVLNNLSSQLQGTKLSFLAGKQLPQKAGSITLVTATWLPTAHNIVNNIGLYQGVATFLFLALSVCVVWLARNKRKMVITLGILYAVLLFLTLVSIRLATIATVNHTQAQYQAATKAAADIITGPLILATRTLLLLSLLTILVAWVSGPFRAAIAVRGKVQLLLEGRAHQAIFSKGENGFTRWVGAHKRVLQWGSVAVVAAIMLVVTLSPALIFWYALLVVLMYAAIELLAAPRKVLEASSTTII